MRNAHLAGYSGDVCKKSQYNVDVIIKDGAPWFRASDITKSLGYLNGPHTVRKYVHDKDTSTVENLRSAGGSLGISHHRRRGRPSLYVTEQGMRALMRKSKKPGTDAFQDWMCTTMLPKIKALDSQNIHAKRQISLVNEFDLHAKVVDFVRRFHPEAILVPGLGENQVTEEMRIKSWQMGYTRGQCDLLLLNKHETWTGMAVELKSPTGLGVVSSDQMKFLERLEEAGYKTLLSNDYDEIIVQIHEYFRNV